VSSSRIGPCDTSEKELIKVDRLKRDLGIRAILALILVVAFIVMIFMRIDVPEGYGALATAAVMFYFANRSTLDKP
jgi:hypothetical protein